jgi:hypothetical protein
VIGQLHGDIPIGSRGSAEPLPEAAAPGGPFLVVCFAGVAPHSQRACEEFLPQLVQAGVGRLSLLLLPEGCSAAAVERPYFHRWVRSLAAAGHEICVQGEPVSPGLARASSLCAALGVAVAGCAAPGARLSTEARVALAAQGFAYAVTAQGIDLLASGRRLPAPAVALAAETSWRVPAAWIMARVLCSARRDAPVLRLEVHPACLYQPALRHTLLTRVRAALATRVPVTFGELAARAAAA